MRQHVSIAQAAQLLAVSPKTVRRRISTGELPAYRSGRIVRIAVADLDAHVRARTVAPSDAMDMLDGTGPIRLRRRGP